MDEMKKGVINLKEDFEDIEPLNDYVLVSITTKEAMGKSKGGIFVVKEAMDAAMPCLQVVKVSKDLLESGWNKVRSGDVIEIADVARLTHFYGPEMEQYSLIDKKYIAGVYSYQIK